MPFHSTLKCTQKKYKKITHENVQSYTMLKNKKKKIINVIVNDFKRKRKKKRDKYIMFLKNFCVQTALVSFFSFFHGTISR